MADDTASLLATASLNDDAGPTQFQALWNRHHYKRSAAHLYNAWLNSKTGDGQQITAYQALMMMQTINSFVLAQDSQRNNKWTNDNFYAMWALNALVVACIVGGATGSLGESLVLGFFVGAMLVHGEAFYYEYHYDKKQGPDNLSTVLHAYTGKDQADYDPNKQFEVADLQQHIHKQCAV
jgi:hypothetical protein